MVNTTQPKEIFNGTDGAIWITTDTETFKVGSMEKFILKQTQVWEDIDLSECMTKKRKLVGVELTGEISKFRIDSRMINIAESYKDGDQLDISIMGKAYNNNTGLEQRVKIKGVTFDELDLLSLEQKTPTKEATNFGAEDYEWIVK